MLLRRWKIRRLRIIREQAQAAYDAASDRRDTRSMHKARQKLLKATHDLMAAEVL